MKRAILTNKQYYHCVSWQSQYMALSAIAFGNFFSMRILLYLFSKIYKQFAQFFKLKYKSVFVFFKTPNMNTRFLNCLKIYSINSLLTHLNDLIGVAIILSLNNQVWNLNSLGYYDNNFTMVYFVYVVFPLWTVFYAFGGNYSCLKSK